MRRRYPRINQPASAVVRRSPKNTAPQRNRNITVRSSPSSPRPGQSRPGRFLFSLAQPTKQTAKGHQALTKEPTSQGKDHSRRLTTTDNLPNMLIAPTTERPRRQGGTAMNASISPAQRTARRGLELRLSQPTSSPLHEGRGLYQYGTSSSTSTSTVSSVADTATLKTSAPMRKATISGAAGCKPRRTPAPKSRGCSTTRRGATPARWTARPYS